MNILILDGNPGPGYEKFDGYLSDLAGGLSQKGHRVERKVLRDLEIKQCTGCWGCWVKTPGECVIKDDTQSICGAATAADFMLFASPMIMGFPSGLLKRTQDRLIPLVLPYIEIVQGECHHKKRYDRYPVLGLLLDKDADCDEEDLRIVTDIYHRLALNLRSRLHFSRHTAEDIQEVLHEFDHI